VSNSLRWPCRSTAAPVTSKRPASQHYRDAGIAPIYEGTNGIQAIDLVSRKLPMRQGAAVTDFIGQLGAVDTQLECAGPALASIRLNPAAAVLTLRGATDFLATADRLDRLAGAGPYLRLFGIATGGWLMARQALAATRKLAAGSAHATSRKPSWLPPISTASSSCRRLRACCPRLPPEPVTFWT
jgi:hypothetical protein